jgi:hypothetical protein
MRPSAITRSIRVRAALVTLAVVGLFVACADRTLPTSVNPLVAFTGATCSGPPASAGASKLSPFTVDYQVRIHYPTFIPGCNGLDKLASFRVSLSNSGAIGLAHWSFWFCGDNENPPDCYQRAPDQNLTTLTDTVTILTPGGARFVAAVVEVSTGSSTSSMSGTSTQVRMKGAAGLGGFNGDATGYTCSANDIGYSFIYDSTLGGAVTRYYYRRNFCDNQKKFIPY